MILLILAFLAAFAPHPTWSAPKNCSQQTCSAEKPQCPTGAQLVNTAAADACCPRYACRKNPRPRNCLGAVCNGVMPTCSQGMESVNKASAGACCPNWVCEEKK